MSDQKQIDDGGPAFPTRSPFICAVHPDGGMRHINTDEYGMGPMPGMSLRDYFAGQIMLGLSARDKLGVNNNEFDIVNSRRAYEIADAMLAARKARR